MTKITPDHLARAAYVYVRQSTADQVQHNHESRRRQFALAGRARELGWSEVVVIDDDLGRSGSGVARPGFERLLMAICEGRVGAVLAVEASRLSRNGRDWHTLLEFCALVGCLLADDEGLYDPRLPNDRLLLGMKGTMSEMELSILRQRSIEALRQKARRGELFLKVAVGYVKVRHDRIEMDPDLRLREAIALVFRKFSEFHSIRQVHLWLRQEMIELPAVRHGPQGRRIVWKLPVYNSVHHMLTNPIYAGAYAFGRTVSEIRLEGGRKRVIRGLRRAQEDWEVLIPEHHEGYISWADYERNQSLIADNANCKGQMARGMIRRGEALLAGLLRCGHCGRKLHVAYSGKRGSTARYHCQGAMLNHGTQRCISFGAFRVDRAVGEEVIRALQPLGMEAALQAIETRKGEASEGRRQAELALEEASYQAAHVRRQYDAVDPGNRLVAGELERRWNEELLRVRQLEERLAALHAQQVPELTPEERAAFLALGTDLERVWAHREASPEARKRILREVLTEIVVKLEGERIELLLHWQGGDHTALAVRKNRSGKHRWATDAETGDLIRQLARLMPDRSIAAILNRAGKRTGKGNSWAEARVRSFRTSRGIAVYRDGERQERNELNLEETAARLSVSKMTVSRLIRRGVIPARQACKGAPWVIAADALDRPGVAAAVAGRGPVTADSHQRTMEF